MSDRAGALLPLLATLGCACPTTPGVAESDDAGLEAEHADSTDGVEAGDADDSGADADPDGGDSPDAGPEDAGDAGTDCEYVGVQVECDPWDGGYVPPPDWEPPDADCGPGCRQVSWGADSLSVSGRRAVFMRDRRILALDLDTLEHRQLACEHAPVPTRPYVEVWPEWIVDVTIDGRGERILYARDLRVPNDTVCDKVAELRRIDWRTGDNVLLYSEAFPNPALEVCPWGWGYPREVGAFGARGAFTMTVASDCRTYLFGIDLETGDVRTYDGARTMGGLSASNVWGDEVALATPGEVYLLDLVSGALENLSDHPADQTAPWLYGDRVVWVDFRNTSGSSSSRTFDVYWYDLGSGDAHRATSAPTARESARIFGDHVVWSDARNATNMGDRDPDTDVWMYDIGTAREIQVTALPGREYGVEVWGNRVYFSWLPPGTIHRVDEPLCECTLPPPG